MSFFNANLFPGHTWISRPTLAVSKNCRHSPDKLQAYIFQDFGQCCKRENMMNFSKMDTSSVMLLSFSPSLLASPPKILPWAPILFVLSPPSSFAFSSLENSLSWIKLRHTSPKVCLRCTACWVPKVMLKSLVARTRFHTFLGHTLSSEGRSSSKKKWLSSHNSELYWMQMDRLVFQNEMLPQ